MKTDFKFKLDPSAKKYRCPHCGQRRFVRYIDAGTRELLPEQYGRCDREVNCGYHLNPYEDKFGVEERKDWKPSPPPPPPPPSYINPDLMRKSFTGYRDNNFVQWLIGLVGLDAAGEAVNRFQIGTSKHWPGSTVFWQIDERGRVHAGKILLYNPTTGKRVKDEAGGAKIGWVHKVLKLDSFNLNQSYFGLHQLSWEPEKPIALCESEKTATVGSVYLPAFTWIATGGKNLLSVERFKPLAGRRVVLFPDGEAFQDWSDKAKAIEKVTPGTRIKVSDLIETHCTEEERKNGIDFCDLLIRLHTPPDGVDNLIRAQWETLNPKYWFMNPVKFPLLTKYNCELLTEDLQNKHQVSINPDEYLRRYLSIRCN